MRGALDHGQLVGAAHHGLRLAVELQHLVVVAAHDQERGRPDGGQPGPGQVGAAAAGDDGIDPARSARRPPRARPRRRCWHRNSRWCRRPCPAGWRASPWPRTAGGPAVRCRRRWRGCRSSAGVSRSSSSVPSPACWSTPATYRFRGLWRLLPLPCANSTTPRAGTGRCSWPWSRTPRDGISTSSSTLRGVLPAGRRTAARTPAANSAGAWPRRRAAAPPRRPPWARNPGSGSRRRRSGAGWRGRPPRRARSGS